MTSTPVFLQGILPFTGAGLGKPAPIDPALRYVVPLGVTAQALYYRGGNSAGDLVAAAEGCAGSVVVDFGLVEV
jgi:assimilatory nitrate reductase catalytic subunit